MILKNILKWDYVIHDFNAHLSLYVFFANDVLLAVYIYFGKVNKVLEKLESPDAGKDQGQKEKRVSEDKMTG